MLDNEENKNEEETPNDFFGLPEDVHLAQSINYPEAYNPEIGLLIDFGAKSLEYGRLINPKLTASSIKSNQSI